MARSTGTNIMHAGYALRLMHYYWGYEVYLAGSNRYLGDVVRPQKEAQIGWSASRERDDTHSMAVYRYDAHGLKTRRAAIDVCINNAKANFDM